MIVRRHISLKNYNTFGIDVTARDFVAVSSTDDLIAALQPGGYADRLVLGGGSNIVLTKAVDGLVIHINNKGKELVYEDNRAVHIKAAAGENWHDVVLWALEHRWGGIENLSLIPGNAGAAPIQNIGAYGAELKDVFLECEAIATDTLELKKFTRAECRFGYRDSIFKNEARG
ncbi:MAG: FAD-binding protein, partial [Sinomicrobium sp.]|nr:FAD-binding protein [Sinomicrobium sp.]